MNDQCSIFTYYTKLCLHRKIQTSDLLVKQNHKRQSHPHTHTHTYVPGLNYTEVDKITPTQPGKLS